MALVSFLLKCITSIFVFYWTFQSVIADANVPILSFYPACDYQVLDKTTVSIRTDTPKSNAITLELLSRIQNKANEAGAEAIILTERALVEVAADKRYLDGSTYKTFRYGFTAEFISLCDNKTAMSSKRTPFNDRGKKAGESLSFGVIHTPQIVIDWSKSIVRRQKHSISDTNVSDTGTIYGIPLLSKFDDVVAVFGDPNVELYVSPIIKLIGYGRNHWLEFQDDKLMRVYTEQPLFTVTGLNFIPLIDFYDDNEWLINNEYGFKSSPLKQRVKKPSYVIKKADTELTLKLDKISNPVLTGFDITALKYQRPIIAAPNATVSHLTEDNLLTLSNEDFTLEQRIESLGQINGIIYDKHSLRKYLIGTNMVVSVRNNTIREIELIENLFNSSSENPNWQVFNFTNGEAYDAVLEKLSTDAIDTGYDIFITEDNYELTLRFYDQGDDKVLYNAVIAL